MKSIFQWLFVISLIVFDVLIWFYYQMQQHDKYVIRLTQIRCKSSNQVLHGKADKILVDKSMRQLLLLSENKVLKSYCVALGWQPEGKKTQEGDGKTPEGLYKIDYKNPNSKYHLSLHISYPNYEDLANAKKLGISAGSDIMIHGGSRTSLLDWTAGCIAVTDSEMDEIWQAVDAGTTVEIKP